MIQNDADKITEMQKRGYGYKRIAAETGLPINSVKTYCRRHPLDSGNGKCEYCRSPLVKLPHAKKKAFLLRQLSYEMVERTSR